MEVYFKSIDEFLEWSHKRENHMKELEQHNYELQMENRKMAYRIEELKKSPAATEDEKYEPNPFLN